MRRRRVITWTALGVLGLAVAGAVLVAAEARRAGLLPAAADAARAAGCGQVERRGDLLTVRARAGDQACIAGAVAAAESLGLTYVDLARAQRAVAEGDRAAVAADRYGDGWAYVFKVR